MMMMMMMMMVTMMMINDDDEAFPIRTECVANVHQLASFRIVSAYL